jgi:hypothetical protein
MHGCFISFAAPDTGAFKTGIWNFPSFIGYASRTVSKVCRLREDTRCVPYGGFRLDFGRAAKPSISKPPMLSFHKGIYSNVQPQFIKLQQSLVLKWKERLPCGPRIVLFYNYHFVSN